MILYVPVNNVLVMSEVGEGGGIVSDHSNKVK